MLSRRRHRRGRGGDAELDITAFLNLMIVLVPVLLLSMVFTHVRIVDLQLPPAAAPSEGEEDRRQVELVLRSDYVDVNFPEGVRVRRIERGEEGFDLQQLSDVLQEIKRQLREQGVERRNVTILAEADSDYQDLVSVIDTARSYRTVVAAAVVDAELFPDIALGDAPPAAGGVAMVEAAR
jgi:biopolymer transport protein ExbD